MDRGETATSRRHSTGTRGAGTKAFTSAVLRVLETVHAVPRGAFAIQEVLNVAADRLVAAGRLGIFTPMYFHQASKPS